MNQTIINPKDIQHYLKDIKKQLLLTHSKSETASIIEMLQTSINEFIEDNLVLCQDLVQVKMRNFSPF